MADNVPTINIMSEKEEDDDHHILTMGDVLTDVEDLDEIQCSARRPKSKLIIKINDDIGSNTDEETFEASDTEDGTIIVKHKRRVCITNFMDVGTVEETCNIIDKMEKTNLKLYSQKNSAPILEKDTVKFSADNIVTDTENLSGSDAESCSDVPDIDVDTNLYAFENDVSTKDTVKYSLVSTPSPCATPLLYLSENESSSKPKKTNTKSSIRLSVSMRQFPNLTDIEFLSEDEKRKQESKKTKKIKKRRTKNRRASKDAEADSDSEPFIHKSDIFLTPKYQMGDGEDAGMTDIEEFEAETAVTSEYVYDTTAITKQLEKMQHFYEPSNEQHSCKGRRERAIKNYRYVSTGNRFKKCRRETGHIHEHNNVCHTDIESIHSTDNEGDQEKLLNPKSEIIPGDITEEEIILETNDYLDNLPEFKLPPAKREIVYIQENVSGTPTVVVAPLEEEATGLLIEGDETTDTENISGGESNDESGEINNEIIPVHYPELDNEIVEEHEFLKQKNPTLLKAPVAETNILTDTEDIFVNTDVKKSKNKRITLTVENQNKSGLTDTEDIYFSDVDKKEPSKRKKKLQVANDTESEEEFGDRKKFYLTVKKPILRIDPDSDRESPYRNETNSIYSDSDVPVSNNECHSVTPAPNNLRKELDDVMSSKRGLRYDSSDEVMYLKGGNYEISSDEDNLSDVSEGWSAPDGQSKDEPTEAVTKQGAAMQGESYGSQQRPEQTAPQTLSREETEESSSQRQTSEQDRPPVADQHMLSDEMKRLLKELEEESKK